MLRMVSNGIKQHQMVSSGIHRAATHPQHVANRIKWYPPSGHTPSCLPAQVVALIRASADSASARAGLMAQHGLSEGQAEAVLGLTLRRLTGLEAGKLAAEATSLTAL